MRNRTPSPEDLVIAKRLRYILRPMIPGSGPNGEITQEELAKLWGCSRSKISQIERGIRSMTDEDAVKLQEIFHVPASLIKSTKDYTPEQIKFLTNIYRLVDSQDKAHHSLDAINAIVELEIKKLNL